MLEKKDTLLIFACGKLFKTYSLGQGGTFETEELEAARSFVALAPFTKI